MVVCLPMFIFTACNNDDDDEGGSESIVGTWYSYDMDDDEYNELSFNADGTGVKYENEIKNVRGKSEGEEIDYFAWKTSGEIKMLRECNYPLPQRGSTTGTANIWKMEFIH